MRILSWLVGLALVILLGLAALTYGPRLLHHEEREQVWVAQPAAPPPAPVAPQVAAAAPAPTPPKVQPVEGPIDSQVEEDAAAVGMTTLEPDEAPKSDEPIG